LIFNIERWVNYYEKGWLKSSYQESSRKTNLKCGANQLRKLKKEILRIFGSCWAIPM